MPRLAPVTNSLSETRWMLVRTDDNNNTYVISENLDQSSAADLLDYFTRRGHKQTYDIHPYTPGTHAELLERLRAIL